MANLAYRSGSSTTAGASSGTTLAINKGAGAATGDIQVYLLYEEPSTGSSTLTGFTRLYQQINTGSFEMTLWARRLDGSESSSFTFSLGSSVFRTAVGTVYQNGTYTGTQPDVANGAQGDSIVTASQTAPSITTLGANRMLVYGHGGQSSLNVTGVTGAASNFRVHFDSNTISDALIAAAGATGTTAPNSGGTQNYVGIHAALISDPDVAAKAPPPPFRPQRVIYRTRRF
jgi:hypothetical protein